MLSAAQLVTLKTALHADSNLTAYIAARDVQAIINYLSADSASVVWRTSTSASDVFNAINWASLTPTDTPDGTTVYTNRALMCQAKQINLQILLQGKDTISSGKSNIRSGLQDGLTNVPSGVGGVVQPAGWPGVKTTISRVASIFENIFATGTKTAASPGVLIVEGLPVLSEVADALYNPDGSMK